MIFLSWSTMGIWQFATSARTGITYVICKTIGALWNVAALGHDCHTFREESQCKVWAMTYDNMMPEKVS